MGNINHKSYVRSSTMQIIAYSTADKRWVVGKLHKIKDGRVIVLTKNDGVVQCFSVDASTVVKVNEGRWAHKYFKHIVDPRVNISNYKRTRLHINNFHGTSLYG